MNTLSFDPARLAGLQALHPWDNPRYTLTDMGDAALFADLYRNECRFFTDRGCWYTYDDVAWREDRAAVGPVNRAWQLADLLCCLLKDIADPDRREAYHRHIGRWRRRTNREAILKDAALVHPVTNDVFDKDPLLFNYLNGTLDLNDCSFHPHDPSDFLSHVANVNYDPAAESARWNRFIMEIMDENVLEHSELPDWEDRFEQYAYKFNFLQAALGYALTGLTHLDCMFILYGASTRNGKSTLTEAFAGMMGDYAMTAMPETLAVQQYPTGRGPSEDVARLKGARFVTLPEGDRQLTLSPSLVKQFTGGDTITARYLHENSFQYRPQFKIYMNTNHLPRITDDTLFASGRVKIIRFQKHFSKEEQDPELKAVFADPACRSAILNWALQGWERCRTDGLPASKWVDESVSEYQHDMDKLGLFMEECLEPCLGSRVRAADVYRRYQSWCDENGLAAESSISFRRGMGQRVTYRRGNMPSSRITTNLILDLRIL